MNSSRADSHENEKTEKITSKTLVIEKDFITADHISLPLKNISLMKVQDNRKKARKDAVAAAIVVFIICASISSVFFAVLEVPATLMVVYVLMYRCHLYIFSSSRVIFILASADKKFLQRIKREIVRADKSSNVYIDMSIRKIIVRHSNDATIIDDNGTAVWSTS